MSAKNRDEHRRWRNKTIAFRVSPEENEQINALAALSGMTKQDYLISRAMARDVVVMGNPRVYKALKGKMEQLIREFEKLTDASQLSPEAFTILEYLARVYDGMKEEGNWASISKKQEER